MDRKVLFFTFLTVIIVSFITIKIITLPPYIVFVKGIWW